MSEGCAPHLFCFGLGYTAGVLARRLTREGWRASGTCRDEHKRLKLEGRCIKAHLFARGRPIASAAEVLASVTDILVSIPPDEDGDPVLEHHADDIARMACLRWVGYLSTTGVYGDTRGAVVGEDAALLPSFDRTSRRVRAEAAWLDLAAREGVPLHVFRLAGIYGPGRSVLDKVRTGRAKRVEAPGHVFSRIHVNDAATILRASMARPDPGRIYNVADDEPAEPSSVVAYACRLLEEPPPPWEPLEKAVREMSPIALSFWRDNRRIDNARIKRELGVRLQYPSYREGLDAVLAEEADADVTGHVEPA